MRPAHELSHDAVRAFVDAVNARDRAAFKAVLTDGATMSDVGVEHDLTEWAEREIFTSRAQMEVTSETDGGLSLVARYRNDIWGEIDTAWTFTVVDGRISRFETGPA
ncbi:nuclear transport factor 2 family protein [Streptomyces gobiensis]|uniref:nuclear transport factor 2 family protein n=1 Tax=Streptomyces gobiensis TaxID=2875706 RepID=UPI001E5D4E9C|nr:nuclear transport factor 2 family protein [Streptomyces gobiensis]UGY94587.1 nuclear transport factor 2 family protein [Streptomyces gobiensis]